MRWRPILLFAGLLLLSLAPLGCQRQTQTPEPKPAQATTPEAKAKAEQNAEGPRSGHQSTVRCLRGERAMTDGDELRCEDWNYVINNYR
ncbi:MAG: hypothetical protein VKM98_04860 [Cyanobacteriota bacterium]|nr:hypothetical protein [Cyanobacteriota bacterium]